MPGGIHAPVEVILSWPQRSQNPIRRGWAITVTAIVLWAITVTVVFFRIWARFIIQRNKGIDDYVIIVGLIPLTGIAILVAGAGRWWGFDKHIWDLTPQEGVVTRQVAFSLEALYIFSTALTKISILLFYRRMATGSISPLFRWIVRGCILSVILYVIAFILALFLGCKPLNAFWNQVDIRWLSTHVDGKDYHCFSEPNDLLSATVVSIIQDFIACFTPVILFWKLQLPFRQKLALAAVFFVGFFTCICAVIRMTLTWDIFFKTYDVSWTTGPAWVWMALEVHLGVICASVPALKVYFMRFFNGTLLTGAVSSWKGHYSKDKRSQQSTGSTGYRNDNIESNTFFSKSTKGSAAQHSQLTGTNMSGYDLELGGIAVTREWEIASVYDETPKKAHTREPNQDISAHRLSPRQLSPRLISPINPRFHNTLNRSASDGSQRPLRYHEERRRIANNYTTETAWFEDSSETSDLGK
ncbi:hypothetical protein BT63DRAFT_273763 [Microthyrium microscopicum]|uniref:Rhodopsin domain-containing protein n=1 Tax=Microthyrium microscopicum TaxID=703497 RepID=A0A6A6U7V8_9PEZI|nr:hypothetical protein BT63DRAFT_273763 [Microthyrium microscopicum]